MSRAVGVWVTADHVSSASSLRLPMSEFPDFRSEKMDSPEGRGIALGRWSAFWYSIPDDVLADAYGDSPKRSIADYDEEVRDDIHAKRAATS